MTAKKEDAKKDETTKVESKKYKDGGLNEQRADLGTLAEEQRKLDEQIRKSGK